MDDSTSFNLRFGRCFFPASYRDLDPIDFTVRDAGGFMPLGSQLSHIGGERQLPIIVGGKRGVFPGDQVASLPDLHVY